jgi:kynurenine formamidase
MIEPAEANRACLPDAPVARGCRATEALFLISKTIVLAFGSLERPHHSQGQRMRTNLPGCRTQPPRPARATARLLLALGAISLGLPASGQQGSVTPLPSQPTSQQKSEWIARHSNWGRWGKDDQLGALHLITGQKRRQAQRLAREGIVVSLARNIWIVQRNPANPVNRPGSFFELDLYPGSIVEAGSADEYIFDKQHFAVHGGFVTHVDSLCHLSFEGKIYNGLSYRETVTPAGCAKSGIQHAKGGIVTRGLLIDLPRLRGVSSLAPSDRLRPDDVVRWEQQTGLKVSAGDAIILYTGQRDSQPPGQVALPLSGATIVPDHPKFDTSMVSFFKERDVAVVGLDSVVADAQYVIVALGLYAINNMDLNELAATARRLNRWEFLLTVAPVATPGATGAIVNPLALF